MMLLSALRMVIKSETKPSNDESDTVPCPSHVRHHSSTVSACQSDVGTMPCAATFIASMLIGAPFPHNASHNATSSQVVGSVCNFHPPTFAVQ